MRGARCEVRGARCEVRGIRIYGGSWRPHSVTLKHTFQLKFKSQYGETKLRYPIFPDAPVRAFDDLVLRAQGSRGWATHKESTTVNTQFIHDAWVSLPRKSGHPVW